VALLPKPIISPPFLVVVWNQISSENDAGLVTTFALEIYVLEPSNVTPLVIGPGALKMIPPW
jgi:hypothetical protein